ncbi:MAG: hypothetical protein GWP04_00545 [Gammaproteobacteria bacterium]|nr:hypothetical protein [Gammaproteobacteria bacterium]
MKPSRTPPVIVIGAHRSGTSLATGLLERLGLFSGWWKEANSESRMFLRWNMMLLRKSGGRWDHPAAVRHLLATESLKASYAHGIGSLLDSPLLVAYLGPLRYARYRSLSRLDFPWGWKDPRNTFTLPLWLNLFPRAKVLHVRRHGVDVAASLFERSLAHRERSDRLEARGAALFVLGAYAGPYARSSPADRLSGAFEIWEEYMAEASGQIAQLPPERALEIDYEDILSSPVETVRAAADFCGLEVGEDALHDAVRSIDPRRGFAYRRDPALVRMAEEMGDRLRRFGYDS